MVRRAELVGLVRPEVSERDLERETKKMEDSFASATNLSANIDTRALQRKLEQAIPGGGLLGGVVDAAVAGRGGGQGGSGGRGSDAVGAATESASTGATLGLLEEQTELLEDIRDELREGEGGGGGGSGAGTFLAGRATAGASVTGGIIGSIVGSLGSLLGGGGGGGSGVLGMLPKLLKRTPAPIGPMLAPGIKDISDALGGGGIVDEILGDKGQGSGKNPGVGTMALTGPLGGKSDIPLAEILGLDQQGGLGAGGLFGGGDGSEGLLPKPAWLEILTSFGWPELPSLSDLSWPNLPVLSSLSWPELPSLSDLSWPAAPDWMQSFLRAVGQNVEETSEESTPSTITYTQKPGDLAAGQQYDDLYRRDPANPSFEATPGQKKVGQQYHERFSNDPAANPSEVERNQSQPAQVNVDVQFNPDVQLQGQSLQAALEDAIQNQTSDLERQIIDEIRRNVGVGL